MGCVVVNDDKMAERLRFLQNGKVFNFGFYLYLFFFILYTWLVIYEI